MYNWNVCSFLFPMQNHTTTGIHNANASKFERWFALHNRKSVCNRSQIVFAEFETIQCKWHDKNLYFYTLSMEYGIELHAKSGKGHDRNTSVDSFPLANKATITFSLFRQHTYYHNNKQFTHIKETAYKYISLTNYIYFNWTTTDNNWNIRFRSASLGYRCNNKSNK